MNIPTFAMVVVLSVFVSLATTASEKIDSLREDGVVAVRIYENNGSTRCVNIGGKPSIPVEGLFNFLKMHSDFHSSTVYLEKDKSGYIVGSILLKSGKVGLCHWNEDGSVKRAAYYPARRSKESLEVVSAESSLTDILRYFTDMGSIGIRIDFDRDGVITTVPLGADLSFDRAVLEVFKNLEVPSGSNSVTLFLTGNAKSRENIFGTLLLSDGRLYEAEWNHFSGKLAFQKEFSNLVSELDPEVFAGTRRSRNSGLYAETIQRESEFLGKIFLITLTAIFGAMIVFVAILAWFEPKKGPVIVETIREAIPKQLQWPMEWVRNLKNN